MERLVVKSNSKIAEMLINHLERRRLVQAYVNGHLSLEELNTLGVKFAQPLSIKTLNNDL
jgi:spore germination protein GerM